MSILQIRMLIRIDEARLAFYQQSVDQASEESTEAGMAQAHALKQRWQLCLERLQLRRAYLAARHRCSAAAAPGVCPVASAPGKLSPAASSLVIASPSGGAVQPGTLANS